MEKQNSFHNTINLSGDALLTAEQKAQNQESIVYTLFEMVRIAPPSQVHKLYEQGTGSNTPLTSIRRAITNLCKRGKLYMTDVQSPGIYGKPEYVWKIAGHNETIIDTPNLTEQNDQQS